MLRSYRRHRFVSDIRARDQDPVGIVTARIGPNPLHRARLCFRLQGCYAVACGERGFRGFWGWFLRCQ